MRTQLPKSGTVGLSGFFVCVTFGGGLWARPVSTASSASIAVNPFDDNDIASEVPILASSHPKADVLAREAGQLPFLCPFVKAVKPIVRPG
jgi:hypothetical protein